MDLKRKRKIKRLGPPGARYGRKLRKKNAEIGAEMKKKHNCPNCEFNTVKRVSVGVWACRKCNLQFAGGAYTPQSKIGEVSKRNIRRNLQFS